MAADYTGSDLNSLGMVRDLEAIDGGYDSANFRYELQTHHPDQVQVGIYLDGDLVGRNASDEVGGGVVALSPGDHTLDLLPLPIGQPLYDRHGSFQGNRVFLKWNPSSSPDVAGYVISVGGVEIETVNERMVYPMDYYRTSAGGRVTVYGAPSDMERINGTFTVHIADGIATFDDLEYPIQESLTTAMAYGLKITWHDDPNEYSSFDVFIGVRSDFTTPPQSPGTHTYTVQAIDGAGNRSTTYSRQAKVHSIPPSVTVADNIITGTDTIDRVNIYSDFNRALNTIEQHIEERFPVQVLMPDTTENGITIFEALDLPIGARYYARPMIGTMERDDLVIHTVSDPLDPIGAFGVIGDVHMIPAPDGNMIFRCDYRPDEVFDNATHLVIDYGTSHDNLNESVSILITDGVGDGVKSFDVLLETEAATDTVIFARVTPFAGIVEGDPSETITGVADADAPLMSGVLGAIST